jgi:hypothetical protein
LRKEIEERSEKRGKGGFEKKKEGEKEHLTNTKQKALRKREKTSI